MRKGKELIIATKEFAHENLVQSWFYTISTVLMLAASMTIVFMPINIFVRMFFTILTSLFMVRMFVIYHDNRHGAILNHSKTADIFFWIYGMFILVPSAIWKRTHDHHHTHNSKLTLAGIGAYPTVTKEKFNSMPKGQRALYLGIRHPITIMLGYITLFTIGINLNSFINSPKKHFDCLITLILHAAISFAIIWFGGWVTYLLAWLFPFLIAHGIGSYLFYVQHNFPGAEFRDLSEWTYHDAALESTSFLDMYKLMHWFTANIGYHHIHHLNVKIPFYRLQEVMEKMPELQNPKTIRWTLPMMWQSFKLKVWDSEKNLMVGLS